MASLRAKLVGGSLLGLLLVIAVLALLGGQHQLAPRPAPPAPPVPVSAPPVPVSAPPPPAPAPAPAPTPSPSHSKGERDWAFFFRAGDTLSRMNDGSALGVVVRLERTHAFPDGSVGPAYAVRSPDQRESIFDADELERSARIEAIREIGRPALGIRPR